MSSILDKAVSDLLAKDPTAKTKPVYMFHDSCFMDSTIFFYLNGKFYEGKKNEVREVIAPRNGKDFQPSKEQVNLAVSRLKENNKGIIFNIEVGHYYGSWVVRGEKIVSKKIADKEMLEITVESRLELGRIAL
jgi:hypothetical protein